MPFNSMLLWLTQNTLKLVKVCKNSVQIGGFFASGSRWRARLEGMRMGIDGVC
jgi:hypothetical protein